ncbi:hypothetical protein B0T16DRAFT_394198 [Cercophora newfieldiana]|uniref:CFEM domain-containing protein n=1 Tax=Cercophora newfieldiana TaxID=92897 RepID=A0AA39XZ66_9PEZI|nr:hypothetical protein B0T16DRAFT_394198 [Cercophora newfieldiana]
MKAFSTLFSLALATVAIAQAIPPCAQGCVDPYLQNGIGDCGTDAKCICANKDFITGISCCLADKCPVSDQNVAISFAAQFCGAVGVSGLPTTVACATASGTSTPTGSASTTATTTTTPTGTAGGASNGGSTGNYGPRQTAAPVLGAIGGLVAAIALL